MTDFLLIHGSAHGAWCWDDLIPDLVALGHTARAIDLPSHGVDQTPVGEVTLDLYAEAVIDALSADTVIVAHSMAGYPATLAADRAPDRVSQLIYLCAHIPIPGKSIVDLRSMIPDNPLATVMQRSADGLTVTIDPAKAVATFYHDVPAARAERAVGNLCPQAITPQATPYPDLPPGDYPRHYIRCMDDRAIPPSYQVQRTADWPAEKVTGLATSHSPFLSDPKALAATLTEIAKRHG